MRTTCLPSGGRIGRGEDGKWRTSVLKEYPDDLCKAFASLFVAKAPKGMALELPDWFLTAVQQLTAKFDVDAPMGPDCCRQTRLDVCT